MKNLMQILTLLFYLILSVFAQRLPNQKINETQIIDIPIVSDTYILRESPNKNYADFDKLEVSRGNAGLRRILLALNFTGIYNPSLDVIPEAYLELTSTSSFSISRFTAHGVMLRSLSVENSTWNCEVDTKLTNKFDECDNGLRWGGSLFRESDPKNIGERIQDNKLKLDVRKILQDGFNGIMIRYNTEEFANSQASFHSLESSDESKRPKLTITIPEIQDNIDLFPDVADCQNMWHNITIGSTTLQFHSYFCAATDENAQFNYLLCHGVPWNALANYALAQKAASLRKYGNIIIPNNYCKGRIGEAGPCPSNSTFGYGLDDEEFEFIDAWMLADSNGYQLDNIIYFVWDRWGPLTHLLQGRRPEKFIGGYEYDSWTPSLQCSEENALIPPGSPGHCNRFGFMPFGVSCQSWNSTTETCVIPRQKSAFMDCMARTESDKCSGCLNDYDFATTGWQTIIWYNNTLGAPEAFPARKSCYALSGFLPSELEPFATNTTPGFFLFSFTPTNRGGTDRFMTEKETSAFTDDLLLASQGSDLRLNQFLFPFSITVQADLVPGSFIQPNGATGRDTSIAQKFAEAAEVIRTSGVNTVYLNYDVTANFLSDPGTGSAIAPPIDPNYIRSERHPTATLRQFQNNQCHAIPLCNPDKVYRLLEQYTLETALAA